VPISPDTNNTALSDPKTEIAGSNRVEKINSEINKAAKERFH
jgi:hypothetical protein